MLPRRDLFSAVAAGVHNSGSCDIPCASRVLIEHSVWLSLRSMLHTLQITSIQTVMTIYAFYACTIQCNQGKRPAALECLFPSKCEKAYVLEALVAAQVEPFLLSPLGFNLRERGRRKDLLRQRSQHLKLGLHEDALPQELQLSYIKYAVLLIPANPSICQSVCQSDNASISHSVNQSTKQSVNQSTHQSVHQPANPSINECMLLYLGLTRGVNRHLGSVCTLST